MKRSLDMIVLSGINLGHNNNGVTELQEYLNHVYPKAIVLNGSFIENRLHADEQVAIIETLTAMADEGTRIYFIANNVPLALQAYPEFFHRNIYFENNLTLRLKGKKYLFLNDNFTQQHLDTKSNQITADIFAKKALEKAIKENASYIVCGHNCKPKIKVNDTSNHRICYLHAGNWQNHLSALEYQWGCWSLYQYENEHYHSEHAESNVYEKNEVIWGSSDIDVMEETLVMPYF